jgi:glycosyltransferase involved in cell wall biosynthesis
MKILAVTNMYPSAERPGNGVFVEQQVKGLLSRGMDVRMMFLDRRSQGPSVYYRIKEKLEHELADFRPDVVHAMYGGVMADRVTKLRERPPTVVTFHGSDLLGENLSGLRRKLISRYGVHCSRKAARRAQGVIVVARHLIRALGKGINPDKIQVIPCGIDLQRFKPMEQSRCQERLGWRRDVFHVLFATGAGDPVKRPELARAAVAGLEEGRKVEFHLMAGVPNSEVPVWLNASDVLLLTSKHEGSPTIVKEALACDLPIVSVNVGDVAERIEGMDGCHLAEAEPGALARKLELVFERRRRLDCRENLHELSCETVAGKLENFYQEIIRGCTTAQVRPAGTGENVKKPRQTVETVEEPTARIHPAKAGC